MVHRRAVFLDRDDTVMVDAVYCRNPDDVRLLPGAAEGIRGLASAGFLIVIATNQSGVGRGYITEPELTAVNERLRAELRSRGADFDALYFCPHTPEDHCACRKPMPGLLLRAASDLDLDLHTSYSIGDREWDVEAGSRAGTRTVLVTNGRPLEEKTTRADYVVGSLQEASELILRLERKGREPVSPTHVPDAP